MDALAIAPAQPQPFRGMQHDFVFATILQFQPAYPVEVHDDRAMDARKGPLIQILLQLLQRAAQDVGVRADMDAGVIAGRLDPIDVGNVEE